MTRPPAEAGDGRRGGQNAVRTTRGERHPPAAPWRRPAPTTRSSTSTAATTTSRRPSYDAKWGVDFGTVGRAQVRGKVEKLLGRGPGPFARALEVGSGTGYFTLNLMQAGVIGARRLHRRVARHARRAAGERASGSASTSRPSAATPRRCRSRTRASTSCSATRCSTTCPSWSARSPSSGACCGPAACCCSPASRRATATGSRRMPKRAGLAAAPLWRRLVARARGAATATARPPDDHALESMVDVHAFAPADLERHAQAAGFERRARARRGAAGEHGSAGSTARSRRARCTRTSRAAGSATPTAATSCCRRSTARCSSRTCPRPASTT